MATELLEQEYMRPVTAEEIANHMGLSEEEVCQTVNEHFFANVLSMDEHVNEMDDSEMQGFILKDEKAPNPEELLVKGEQIKELSKVITQLSEKEQLVLSLFYHEELTLTEIGEIMGLSTSRISQIHSKALFKLKNILEKQL